MRATTFQSSQQTFARALCDAHLPVPHGVVGRDGAPSLRRFNVYRNNVVAGQVDTLRDAYPATARLVGETFFRAMARDYVLTHSPATPMMFDYGIDFPSFVDAFEPARELPYLGDVARIERAWVEAYHSPEALPLSALALQGVLSSSEPRWLTVQLHPSMRVLSSLFPALSIWEMNTGASNDMSIDLDGPEDVLIVRPDAHVHLYRLPKGGATFFAALAKGASLVDAAEQTFAGDDAFDLVASMAMLIDARIVMGTRVATKPSDSLDA
ncbi:DNA-binding domain-containing protein [Dyella sp. C11]|uniref:HvfC/BufC N-terminal domain-containing protein n=1 Tax=Dyella sp. C11 TaxID=2126991 RepID=UPI000D64E4EA|nr:DNA-binding domain-containing protein [Dyella sp. C11]